MRSKFLPTLLFGSFMMATAGSAVADGSPQVREQLKRGFTAVSTTTGNLLSWRRFADDEEKGISYVIQISKATGTSEEITIEAGSPTNYLDTGKGTKYAFSVRQGETTIERLTDISPESSLRQIRLNRPAGGTTSTGSYTYTPNDCSVGDVDGDGEYEIIVKWDPSNSQDNSQSTYRTGNTIFDCYEITGPDAGKHLWRIDLGINVRAGAHYSPFLVYDFDGDGKAEFVVKTGPGSKDAAGNYVSDAGQSDDIRNTSSNTTDYRNSKHHILKGEEFLTIFSGETGKALRTVWYWPNLARGAAAGSGSTTYSWSGDTYGNRGHRYNACVAYLDGLDALPSIIMQRGYYTEAYFWAVDWDGTRLSTRWLHRGTSKTAWSVIGADGKLIKSGSGKSSYGQGVHGISVGDVDDDGFDEIVMGSATIDHDGTLLCSTGFGHGDAIHLGKIVPERPGLQVYLPHEDKTCGYGDDLHDAATGEVIYRGYTDKDNGRGVAADFIYQFDDATGLDTYRGWEMWSGAMSAPVNAVNFSTIGSKPDTNFRIYWNGNLFDESLDGKFDSKTGVSIPRIVSWDGSGKQTITIGTTYGGRPQSCNGTKATPCLTADLYGDWREEMIFWDAEDNATLNIYTTTEPSPYPVPCLMTDHVYRMGVAWQNSSYNQPPHLGYYLPDAYLCRYELAEGSLEEKFEIGQEVNLVFNLYNVTSVKKTGTVAGLTYTFDKEAQTYTVSGTPTKVLSSGYNSTYIFSNAYNSCKASGKIYVTDSTTGIGEVAAPEEDSEYYDLQGRRLKEATSGQFIIRNGKKILIR